MRQLLSICSLILVGCGSSLMDEPVEGPSTAPSVEVAPPPKKQSAPPGSLWREDVNFTVDEGLGYFLQRVTVEPEIIAGKFQGFRIVDLRPAEFWQGVDLKPGDVVTRVNGMPIERDIDAYEAFQSLRAANALRVSVVRGAEKRELVYSIVVREKPSKASAPAAPANPAPAAAPKQPPS